MRPQPFVCLADVEAGSRWFTAVLGLTSGHGGDEYEMLLDGDDLVLQLHRWDVDDHVHLGDPAEPSRGNGVVLWFSCDDVDAAFARVASSGAEVLDGPLHNPNAHHREVWLRGPEGYVVVVSGPFEGEGERG